MLSVYFQSLLLSFTHSLVRERCNFCCPSIEQQEKSGTIKLTQTLTSQHTLHPKTHLQTLLQCAHTHTQIRLSSMPSVVVIATIIIVTLVLLPSTITTTIAFFRVPTTSRLVRRAVLGGAATLPKKNVAFGSSTCSNIDIKIGMPSTCKSSKKKLSSKSVAQLYDELFSKTHGDRIDWFIALQEWLNDQKADVVTRQKKIERVLYLGSYIHIGASIVWPTHVTYVDMDKKAVQFFEKHDHNEIVTLINNRRQQQSNQHNWLMTTTMMDGSGVDETLTTLSLSPSSSFQFLNVDFTDKDRLRGCLMTRSNNNDDDNQNDDDGDGLLYDLLISSYAGFVSRAGKDFIRRGGLLLANNSHGDASLAYVDKDDWELIGVVTRGKKPKVSTQNLEQYMIPKPKKLHGKKKKQISSSGKTGTKRKRKENDADEANDNEGDNNESSSTEQHPTAEDIIKLGRGIGYTKDAAAYIFRKL
jgi:hypothetical protein